uniref:Centromere-associated protein E n=1 Tax=Leptobrachium leishanense TaxID=445787 RepID=A0A8C5LPC5_9ANUR
MCSFWHVLQKYQLFLYCCAIFLPLREQGDQVNLFWKTEKSTISQVDGTKSFNFDRVFHSNETSDQVYQEMAVPILQSVLHGYHGTIFAYGQTSSGKTYTMMGTANSIGIIPQAVQDTFKIIQEIRNREFLLRVSYMEIYNETVTDLLCDDRKKKPLEVREDLDRTVYVADLTEEIVMVPDQVMKWIKKGEKNRHYGETKMNEHSSRSHTIFRMIIESRERSDPGNSENCDGAVMVSHLNLVDLAGSERASQTGAEGVRLKEGCNINRSLFILGQVIKKLSDGQAGGFINYRDSKLTRILQNSLGGNTKTLIICTVTPVSFDETLSTLQFASTAKHVRNTPHVNEVVDDQALLKRYRKEILDLKKQLEQLEATSGVRTHAMAKEEHAQLLAEIQQLQNERENRIWNLTSIIIAPSQESEKDQKAKRKRRVTWAPGKLKNSLGSSCFSDFDIPSKTSNFIKKRKFSDLPLLTEVDDSICTEVSDFDETAPELDLNPMGKVSIRAKKTAAFCQSMIDFDCVLSPYSNQFNDFSQQKSKEMEQKITDLESQLKKITQEYESDAKEKESFANEIASLKEKLQLKEEETNNIVKALELQITNLEGQLHTVGTREPVNKCSVDIKELHSEKDEIQGGKMAALEEIQTLLGNHVVEQEIIAEKFPSDPHHLCQEHIQMLEQKILDLEQAIETLGMQLKQDENYHKEDFMESIQLCEALMTEKVSSAFLFFTASVSCGNALEEMNTMRNNYDSVILENESLKKEIKGLEQQLNEKNDTKEFEVLEKEMQKEHEAQLMHEIVSLKKVVENAEVYNQDLEADLETKSNILKDQNKQIHELKKTVDVLQKKVRNLDLSSSMGDSDKLCEEVFQLKQSLADAEAVTRDAQKESAFLKSENRELNEKMVYSTWGSQQREKDASTYEKQLEAEKAKFKNMQADLQKELQYSFNEINHLNGLMAGKVPKDLLARVELEKEIQNYSKQLAEITEEKRVLETEVASLSEYKSLPNEIEHLKTQLCQATEELSLLKQEQSLFSKKDNTIREQSNQINRLTEEVAEVQAKFHETEEQFAELKKAHKELEEQYLSSSETLILKQNESECLAKEREELQGAINCMEIQLSTTLKELDQAVKDKGGLLHEQDIFVKNQQVAHTVMEEKSSQFTIPLHNLDEVKSLVTEKDAVLKSVEKERDHLQEQVNNLCSQVELLQEQTNELHKGEEMYKQQQSRMKLEVEQLQICLKEARVSLDVTQEEKLEVFQKLECIEKDLVLVDQQRRELLSSLENIKAERDDLRRDLNENIELVRKTQLVKNLKLEQTRAENTLDELQDQARLQSEVENLLLKLDETQSTIEYLQSEKKETEQALGDLQSQMEAITLERDELKVTETSLMSERDKLNRSLQENNEMVVNIKNELLQKAAEGQQMEQEKQELELAHQRLKDESEQLMKNMTDTEEKLQALQKNKCESDQQLLNLQQQMEILVQERDDMKSAQDCMISERNQLNEDLEKQTQLLLNSKNEQKQRCKNEVEQITRKLKETEANVNALKEDELEIKQTLCNLKQQIENLTQERDEVMVTQENLISERDQLKEDLKENVEMAIETQDDLRKAQDEVQHHKHKVHQMASQISLLEEKVSLRDILVKISGIYSDQYNLIDNLSSEMQNEAETSKTAMSRLKDFLSHTQSRSFRTLQTEHTKIHLQLKTVIHKFKEVCMTAAVKEEQYSLIKDCEEELIAEQKKHDEIELQIQCLEQYGTKWTDSAAEDLKFYELEFLSKMICKKCDFIKVNDFSEIQEVLSSTESALQDEVKRERSFYMWLNEFSSPNFNVTELNEGVQQENRRIIGMIQLMTNKLKAIIPSKTQRAVSEYLKQMQTELEMTKEKYSRLSKKLQHVAPSGNTSALEEENVRLRENIRGLQADLKKMQSRIKILEEQLNASRAETKQKEEKVAYLQSNLLLNTAETELVKIRAQLTEKESSLQSLRTEIEDLQNTIAKGAKPYREEIDNLKTQLVKSDMEKMKRSKTMDQEIASLKSCIEDKEECLRKLKEQLRRTQKDCDTSVCSDKEHPVSSNFPLTCGGGSGIAQSTAMLVLQSKNAKLEKQLSFYKKRYSQHSK